MYKIPNSICFLLFSGSILFGCSRTLNTSGSAQTVKSGINSAPSPPCLIYKTKSDYSKNIPVILSDDKTVIVSYPDVKDVYYKGILAYPTVLNNGFLLDNRGIGPNVAFLTFTYEQFSKMNKTPSSTELFQFILDREPLLEMYQCGNRNKYSNIESELNELISSGNLKSCKKLK